MAAAAGCTSVGIDYHTPATHSPTAYGESHKGPTTAPAEPVDLTKWWKTFHDPELDSLVTRAVENNNTLKQAQARVWQARAELGVAWGNAFPTGTVGLTATRNQTSRTSSAATSTGGSTANTGTTGTGGTGGTTGGTTTGGTGSSTSANSLFPTASRRASLFQGRFDAGWEIDVFGGIRRQIEVGEDEVELQINARRNTLVTLTAEVARDYLLLRGYQLQLNYAKANLKSEQDTLEVTRSKFKAGLTSDLDVAQAQASVAQTAATIPSLEIQIKQTIHMLGILLGDEPMALSDELERVAPIPPTPAEIPVGLPSELLRRRPDVRQSERALAEATANIGVVVSDLFPKFSLTGSVGQQSGRLGLIARQTSSIWSIGPTMSWQILDYSQLQSRVRVANAQQQEALYTYRQTVLQSFADVEDALVAYAEDQNRTKALNDEVAANQRAVDLSTQLYKQGIGDFLNVLTAQRALFTAQNDLASSQSNVATDLVQLFKAMGGGWDEHNEQQFEKSEDPSQRVAME